MRVALPDVPGSLGVVATALGDAGADIQAIEIVERRNGDQVVDDVLLELPAEVMPDALVTACHGLDGVEVEWISRYAPGASLSLDLEAVEAFTAEPVRAIERMTELLPVTFRAEWALAVSLSGGKLALKSATGAAPELPASASDWFSLDAPSALDAVNGWPSLVLAAAPATMSDDDRLVVVIGRHGGPDFLASEVARLGHMVQLAASVVSQERAAGPKAGTSADA